ncbi:MAG: hypothetical protein ABIA11_01805 [Patescibacteria group bacterium]
MGWHYENLTDEELQRIATVRFGKILKPVSEIGREVVIDELRAYDRIYGSIKPKRK